MFTKTEKGYLVLTLVFLAAGTGIKAYRHAAVKLGPFHEAKAAQEAHEAHEARDARDVRNANEVPRAATIPGASETGPDPVSDASVSVHDEGLGSLSGDASQSDGTGGRDTVSDSSSGSADPIPLEHASAKASESHRTAQLSTSKPSSKTKSAPKSAFTGKVDLNRAEAPELTRVPGIGAKTAQAIVDHRRANGPYRAFRDLLQIKGIGEKKLEKLIPNLIL